MNVKTEGELLFEQYLTEHGHTDFKYEEPISGSAAVPDYQLPWEPQPLLFELKGFEADVRTGSGVVDPYPPLRRKIDKAKEKFKNLKTYSCSLVLQHSGPGLIFLEPPFLYGAMLGDLGFKVPIRIVGVGNSEDLVAQPVFTKGGRMIKCGKGAVPEDAMNTTINAIIVIEHYSPGQRVFDRHVKGRESALGRSLTVDEIIEELGRSEGTARDPSPMVLRVVVHENPYAATSLCRETSSPERTMNAIALMTKGG